MKQYVVGGAVRDTLLGYSASDIDYVWTGATADDMVSLGYASVGSSFPVFLDSRGNQHALARRELKTGTGYRGFSCMFDTTITLEEDLHRRDFSINAMAVDVDNWDQFVTTQDPSLVIDPFNGLADLSNRLIKHISSHFSEDPLRILRGARFAARYKFKVDLSTIELMKEISHELDDVSQDRIWVEMCKGVNEQSPFVFATVLMKVGVCKKSTRMSAFEPMLNEMSRSLNDVPQSHLDHRSALLVSSFTDDQFQQYRVPSAIKMLAKTWKGVIDQLLEYSTTLTADQRVSVLETVKAFNNTPVLLNIVKMTNLAIEAGWVSSVESYNWSPDVLDVMISDVRRIKDTVRADVVADQAIAQGKSVREAVHQARVSALEL